MTVSETNNPIAIPSDNGRDHEDYPPLAAFSTSPEEQHFYHDGVSEHSEDLQRALVPAYKTNEQKLLELTNNSGVPIVQRNGQRIYGGPPPAWEGPPPAKGCEVFVGKLPRDCFEDELVPLFSSVAPIYELRLMMDFSGSNRGFCFVRYGTKEDAKRAVDVLNSYEIRPNKPLGVLLSVDNRKLWISGIPKNYSAEQIKAEMSTYTDGVLDVILYPSQMDKSKPRGYAFVEYESHRAAALARRRLVPTKFYLGGQQIDKVDWAEPENEIDEEVMSKVQVLFIRNLMPETTEMQIRDLFETMIFDLVGEAVDRVRKAKDYAFVHFSSRKAAEVAKEKSEGLELDGSCIDVSWSKPVDKNIYNQRKQLTRILSVTHGNGGRNGPPHCYHNGFGYPYDSPLAQLSIPQPSAVHHPHYPHNHHHHHPQHASVMFPSPPPPYSGMDPHQPAAVPPHHHVNPHIGLGAHFPHPNQFPGAAAASHYHHAMMMPVLQTPDATSMIRGAPGTAPPRRLVRIAHYQHQNWGTNP